MDGIPLWTSEKKRRQNNQYIFKINLIVKPFIMCNQTNLIKAVGMGL